MPVLPVGTRRKLMKHPLGWIAAGLGGVLGNSCAPAAPNDTASAMANAQRVFRD